MVPPISSFLVVSKHIISHLWNSQAEVKCPNPSTSQINCLEVYSTSASKRWLWHHDVMAKRTIMEVWKAKKKGSNGERGNHKTRGSPVVDTLRSSDCHATNAHRAISV